MKVNFTFSTENKEKSSCSKAAGCSDNQTHSTRFYTYCIYLIPRFFTWKYKHVYRLLEKKSAVLRENNIHVRNISGQQTKSIEDFELLYDDEKNSMIAITESSETFYEDFYDELDNRLKTGHTMDIILYGPINSFLRLDAETIIHILTYTKKEYIPISRTLLAWDIVTDGKTSAFLQGRELLAFGDLLNVVPEEDLYYLNFGNPSVFKYFANNKVALSNRKFGILIASYRRYFGNDWYNSSTYINELGYLICRFPSTDLKRISPPVFKELNVDVMSKLDRCSVEQSKILYNIATHTNAYGEPYKWSSNEISRLHSLLNCVPNDKISSIKLEAISAVSPNVIKYMDQNKLQYFTRQQILRMDPKTRRIYILRMQLKNSLDTSQITRSRLDNIQSNTFTFALLISISILLSLA